MEGGKELASGVREDDLNKGVAQNGWAGGRVDIRAQGSAGVSGGHPTFVSREYGRKARLETRKLVKKVQVPEMKYRGSDLRQSFIHSSIPQTFAKCLLHAENKTDKIRVLVELQYLVGKEVNGG